MSRSTFKSESWVRRSRGGTYLAFLWNETYSVGTYVLWPATTETLKMAIEDQGLPGFCEDGFPNCSACHLWHKETGTHVLAFTEEVARSRDPATIAHEALHFTGAALAERGVEYSVENDEPFTFFLGWTVEKITKLLRAHRPGRKQSPGTP